MTTRFESLCAEHGIDPYEHARTEEEYFADICRVLAAIGVDESRIEQGAHDIMDVWTFDGVLDTDSLDEKLSAWEVE